MANVNIGIDEDLDNDRAVFDDTAKHPEGNQEHRSGVNYRGVPASRYYYYYFSRHPALKIYLPTYYRQAALCT